MKKIFYIVLSLMLIIPFSVKAEENQDELRGLSVWCQSTPYTDEELGEDWYTCGGIVYKPSSDTVNLEFSNGNNENVDIWYEGKTEGDIEISFNGNEGSFSFFVINEAKLSKDEKVTLGITAKYNDDSDLTISKEFDLTLKASNSNNSSGTTTPTTPTTPNKPTNPTNPSTSEKPTVTNTSKGIANPNTADMNILQLSLVGILFIFIMILSIRKINLLRNSR